MKYVVSEDDSTVYIPKLNAATGNVELVEADLIDTVPTIGATGERGMDGEAGPAGADGEAGADGADGADGIDGIPRVIVTELPAIEAANQDAMYIVRNDGQPDYVWFVFRDYDGVLKWGQFYPRGGTTGQVLAKLSGADYDIGWTSLPVVVNGPAYGIETPAGPVLAGVQSIANELYVAGGLAGGAVRSDNFNRSSGALGIPSDGGSAWVSVGAGSHAVVNNKFSTFGQGSAQKIDYLETGVADCELQAKLITNGAGNCLVFRLTDANNYWYVTAISSYIHICRVVAGVNSDPAFTGWLDSTTALAANDIIKASISGAIITVYKNGVQLLQRVDPSGFNRNATKHGFTSSGVLTSEWDDFTCTA